jgi:hypothetical protein
LMDFEALAQEEGEPSHRNSRQELS